MRERQGARLVADLGRELAAASPRTGGALWRLAESGRDLDANLLRLPPGRTIGEHTPISGSTSCSSSSKAAVNSVRSRKPIPCVR